MNYVRPVDFNKFDPTNFHTQFIGDNTNGVTSCNIFCTQVPPGTGTPSLHVHTGDEFFFILKGEMNLQLAEYHLKASAGDLVFVPQGVPHRNWNNSGDVEVHFGLDVPGIPQDMKRTYPISAPDPKAPLTPFESDLYVRHIDTSQWQAGATPLIWIIMAERRTGSMNCQLALVQIPPGKGGPRHIHTVDQFYFVLDGEMTIEIGQEQYTAGPNTCVVLPAGTPHRSHNNRSTPETHIEMNVPEPFPGQQLTIPIHL